MKLMVYSHDAFGLGNIRRMLAICQYLLKTIPNVSILVVSGSPALHSLRLPAGLDYIKLPCIGRDASGAVTSKYLNTEIEEAVKLRSDLILSTTRNFKPDLFLVDKKPDGLQSELRDTLAYLKADRPETKLVLLLRDILDRPEATITQWQRHGYHDIIASQYHQVWVVGTPDIFDVRTEYQFPPAVACKVCFCGYIQRDPGLQPRDVLRQALQIQPQELLVLVTPGGGGDGYHLVDTYLSELANLPQPIASLIISGPEMLASEQEQVRQRVAQQDRAQFLEFTDDMASYMDAADVVISMGGYNTIGEILSLRKRAIVVPRTHPVEEQWIRAERMSKLGLFDAIHPDQLTPTRLGQALTAALSVAQHSIEPFPLDMNALPRITAYVKALVSDRIESYATDRCNLPTFKVPLEALV